MVDSVSHTDHLNSLVLGLDSTQTNKRNRAKAASKHLRPAVLLDESISYELEAGDELGEVMTSIKECEILLVVGTSLISEKVCNLVRDLARALHAVGGAVVYIDTQPLNIRKWNSFIDFHMQVDIEECASQILASMDEVSDPDLTLIRSSPDCIWSSCRSYQRRSW